MFAAAPPVLSPVPPTHSWIIGGGGVLMDAQEYVPLVGGWSQPSGLVGRG